MSLLLDKLFDTDLGINCEENSTIRWHTSEVSALGRRIISSRSAWVTLVRACHKT
jgi:hypothetical protein